MWRSLCVCSAFLMSVVTAHAIHASTFVDKLPSSTRSATLIESLNDSVRYQNTENQNQLFPPASTLKLVTALAAKLELKESFRFKTRLTQHNNDFVIHFSGDPTLTNKDLKKLLSSIPKHQNIHNIWLDNTAFSGYDRAVGWPWDILGVCYSAPASAITLDNNCVQASIYTQKNGSTRVYVPEHQPIYVSTLAKSVSKTEQESTLCKLELTSSQENHYQLQGCLSQRKKPLPLKFAVQNPALYTQRITSGLINQLQLSISGEVKVGTPPTKGRTLAVHQSVSLDELLEAMLKKSDNLIADNLTKTLGAHFYHQPGSFDNGIEAIKQILFSRAGIDIEQTPLADGSGLSRNNRFSAQNMANVLRYIWQNDKQLGLIKLMPHSGQSGTLKYRKSMRKAPIKGQIIAKSGSLYGSHNMAGFGLDKDGRPTTLFIQFVTDYYPIKQSNKKKTVAPIVQFEKMFYQEVVKFSQAIPKT